VVELARIVKAGQQTLYKDGVILEGHKDE
jgi:hypothetical protein